MEIMGSQMSSPSSRPWNVARLSVGVNLHRGLQRTRMRKKGEHMMLKMTRFVSLICAALACGLTMTHNLEMPGKQLLSGANWLIVQHTFYGGFAIVGGIAEILGLISTGVLLVLLRQRHDAFAFTLVAAISFAAMLALFAFGNNPLNQHIA